MNLGKEGVCMRSRNIVFPERGRAELIEEEIQEIRAGEVLVHLAVSTTSSGTERANLLGSDTVDWTAPLPANSR